MKTFFRTICFLSIIVFLFQTPNLNAQWWDPDEWGLWAYRVITYDQYNWHPCNIHYVIADASDQNYNNNEDYVLVGISTSYEELENLQRYFSKYYEDQPDNIAKLESCYTDTPRLSPPKNVTAPASSGGLWGNTGGGAPAFESGWGIYAYTTLIPPSYWPDDLGWYPCDVLYVIEERPKYDNDPDYVLIETLPSWEEADNRLSYYSVYFDDNPDNVVKLFPCYLVKEAVRYAEEAVGQVDRASGCPGCSSTSRWTPYFEDHLRWGLRQLSNDYQSGLDKLDYETEARAECIRNCSR